MLYKIKSHIYIYKLLSSFSNKCLLDDNKFITLVYFSGQLSSVSINHEMIFLIPSNNRFQILPIEMSD